MADVSSPGDEVTPRRLGRYELGPEIAAGGMARLFLARATGVHGFQKYVVVKRILSRWAHDREFVEMFLDEARLAAQLDHPNVVHVHDIGEDDEGPFFAMDYIHGQNLLAIMRALRARGTPIEMSAAVAIGSAAAAGLHHAHDRRGFDGRPLGLIHRDVSPTNVIATYEGGVQVVDFGIAKASTSRHATRPSVRKGKMAYMSPEQCRGDRLDRRSDVFALGIVLYELITLSRAFQGEGDFAIMNRIVNHDVEPASVRRSDVPPALDAILARALARDPSNRYASARELQRDLDAFAAEAGLSATPAAIATMMEELFGRPKYPWEGVSFAAEIADDADASHDSGPSTVVKTPRPSARAQAALQAAEQPRRRVGLRVAILGASIVGLGSLAWAAGRDRVAPVNAARPAAIEPPAGAGGDADAGSEPVAPADPVAKAPPASSGAEVVPAAAAPDETGTAEAAPGPSDADAPLPAAERASERPRASSAARAKSRRPRARPAEPAPPGPAVLPPPFDPDAPAPRPE